MDAPRARNAESDGKKSPPQDLQREVGLLQAQLDSAKRELEGLVRMKTLASVASSVVHDIRNSLGIISSTTQFVLSKLDPKPQEKQAWELVDRNVESIKKILKDYLGIARQMQNSKESCSLNEIVKRVRQFLEPQTRKRNVEVSLDLDDAAPALPLDIAAIESSVLNVALNALEAMEHDGTLSFATRWDPALGKVTLEVKDTGPGIATEILEKIFSPFYTTKATGTGMGLYSARAAVENNGGKILCESKEGAGTKMLFLFAAAQP